MFPRTFFSFKLNQVITKRQHQMYENRQCMTDYKYIKSNSFILKRCEKEAKQRAVAVRSVVPNADGEQPWELWEPHRQHSQASQGWAGGGD